MMTFDEYCKQTGHYAENGDRALWNAAQAAEREACAKVLEDNPTPESFKYKQYSEFCRWVANSCRRIRARSNVKVTGLAPEKEVNHE